MEAQEKRDELIAKLALLPPLPAVLDKILHHFGHEEVAEVTGRSRRILKEKATGRLFVSDRSSSANIKETEDFMDGKKNILIFSDAGGTGRSYHADLQSKNIRRRSHVLIEPGFRAETAIQGLGRTHRTNQHSAPIFRPVVSNVCGEKRFISAMARRLDALGALTKGQRESGGQGLFKAKDNLESDYANLALKRLFFDIYNGRVPNWGLTKFEKATGLTLSTE